MKIISYAVFLLFFTSFSCFSSSQTEASGLITDGALRTAAFWQQNTAEGDSLVMTQTQRKAFNRSIQQNTPYVIDLTASPDTEQGEAVKKIIEATSIIPDGAYDKNGQLYSQPVKDALLREMNLENMPDAVPLRMGVTVRRSSIRTLPTAEPAFEEPYPSMFDLFQETAVDPSEALLVLYTSLDGQYYYVQLYNYSGWISAADVALTADRGQWLRYADPQKFLVVTEKSYELNSNNESIFYQMGSRIPFVQKNGTSYNIILPQRNEQGNLTELAMSVSGGKSFSEGYLPYTRSNIIQEAFYYLDEPYGWGGLRNSVDCSSFIANIYRTVGIFLPRNADQQENAVGQHFPFTSLNESDIYSSISQNCRPGDAFFMDGHVMLYLGELNNTPYIIHALGSYTENNGGQKIKQRILRVVVSDLSLNVSSGTSFASVLTSAVSFH
ncbi:C40 family peptidase [Pectinatus haikarae]|uniref:NlpC/P60 domain-containing protein n=1 Tax=Pectinatus haikarae TaxID=349096 RepID=A0ABT9Y5Z7_9FIRM|nr:NlpC/P60 family protein [Pectinatus haikarae]MDQ0203139.1 hypothetical protein [Pectinatus haikarae]